jgi:hypothetical protein
VPWESLRTLQPLITSSRTKTSSGCLVIVKNVQNFNALTTQPVVRSNQACLGAGAGIRHLLPCDSSTNAWPDHMHDLHASTRSRTRGVVRSGPVGQKKKKLIPIGENRRRNTKGRHVIRPVLLPGSRTGHGREKARAWKSTPTPPWPRARTSQGQPSRSHTNQRHGDIYRRLSTVTRRRL